MHARSHTQIPLLAGAIGEPAADWPTVDMFSALPMRDRQYDSCEQHVVERTGKPEIIANELEQRLGFVGFCLGLVVFGSWATLLLLYMRCLRGAPRIVRSAWYDLAFSQVILC